MAQIFIGVPGQGRDIVFCRGLRSLCDTILWLIRGGRAPVSRRQIDSIQICDVVGSRKWLRPLQIASGHCLGCSQKKRVVCLMQIKLYYLMLGSTYWNLDGEDEMREDYTSANQEIVQQQSWELLEIVRAFPLARHRRSKCDISRWFSTIWYGWWSRKIWNRRYLLSLCTGLYNLPWNRLEVFFAYFPDGKTYLGRCILNQILKS